MTTPHVTGQAAWRSAGPGSRPGDPSPEEASRAPLRPSPAVCAAVVTSAVLVLTGCAAVRSSVGGVEPRRGEETGEILEAAEADAFALPVGDCLDRTDDMAPEELTTIVPVPTVPCDEARDSEVDTVHQMTDETSPR